MKNCSCLVVGISGYRNIRALPISVTNDANVIHNLVSSPQLGYLPDNAKKLLDTEATAATIRQELESIAKHSDYESTVIIYFSGHGAQVVSGPHAGVYLLPVDAQYDSDETLAATSISGDEFSKALRKIRARRVLVIFDCCYSGGIGQPKSLNGAEVKEGLPEHYYQQLAKGNGRVIISSSRGNEVSWVFPGETNSLFTKHLLNGLKGEAIKVGNSIRVFDLFDYIQPRVTEEQPNQHPIFKAELEENFPIALLPKNKSIAFSPKTSNDEFRYDIFISYRRSQDDRNWVKKQLVPALKTARLRVCLDDTCFRLGRPVIMEMERAVLESRYTLAVFSADYMDSGFTELENVMAQHLGLETRKVRFIGLIYKECQFDLRFRTSLMLDMRDSSEFDENIQRIAYEAQADVL